jgi:UDP-N-acetylmuramoyl-L-alanine---L-glutamate ligase
MLISELENKKVLILGLGQEGIDNLLFLKKRVSCKKIGVADSSCFEDIRSEYKEEIKDSVSLHLGEDYLSSTKEYDVIIKSPGVPFHIIKKEKSQVITSQSDIFIKNCKGKIIGVTGTKGKSTTCLMLHHILKKIGHSSFLIGNIGNPSLGYLGREKESDIFIYELSSFQLQTVTKSPHIAIVLNLFKDHLDKHKDFEEYFLSKKKIVDFQKSSDFVIYNQENSFSKEIGESSLALKIPFSEKEKIKQVATSLDPVFKALSILGVEKEEAERALLDFQGLPHRMEYVGLTDGVYFYNDSAATIPEATAKALEEIKNVGTVIIGGKDKGADVTAIVEAVKERDIKNIVIFKESPAKLEKEILKTNRNVFTASSMKEAVDYGKRKTKQGEVCLLSPGFASFGMFKDYKERGDLFKKYAK